MLNFEVATNEITTLH